MLLNLLRSRLCAIARLCNAWRRLVALSSIVLSLLLTGCSLPEVSAESRLFAPVTLEFLDRYTLATDAAAKVGGLSGLTYDRQKGVFYAVSDDRSNRAPARFYTLQPQLANRPDTGRSVIKQVKVTATTTLQTATGEPYPSGQIDAEGIARSPRNTVFISSEGDADRGLAPSVGEYDLATGKQIKALPIPATYVPREVDDQALGIQNNKGFEGLTINADATADLFRVFAAVEQPLVQDRLPLPEDEAAVIPKERLRLLHYALISSRADLIGEYVYELDPGPVGTIENGLSEILSIDNAGRFLALERSLGLTGFTGRIFQFSFAGARDVQTVDSLRGLPEDWQPVKKKLMLDLATLPVAIDNVEGMTLGPMLPDGSQSLWIVSDDNFDQDQETQFLLFSLTTKQ